MNPQPEREPSAELRIFAKSMREMYLALIREAFTPAEALAIVGYAIQGAMGGGR